MIEWLEAHHLELATAAPVWHELRFGSRLLAPSARRKKLERYLDQVLAPSLPVLPYDTAAADWHAGERARLSQVGRPPAFVDGQIAAVAAVNDLVLVTLNVQHFNVFRGLEIETALGS